MNVKTKDGLQKKLGPICLVLPLQIFTNGEQIFIFMNTHGFYSKK